MLGSYTIFACYVNIWNLYEAFCCEFRLSHWPNTCTSASQNMRNDLAAAYACSHTHTHTTRSFGQNSSMQWQHYPHKMKHHAWWWYASNILFMCLFNFCSVLCDCGLRCYVFFFFFFCRFPFLRQFCLPLFVSVTSEIFRFVSFHVFLVCLTAFNSNCCFSRFTAAFFRSLPFPSVSVSTLLSVFASASHVDDDDDVCRLLLSSNFPPNAGFHSFLRTLHIV